MKEDPRRSALRSLLHRHTRGEKPLAPEPEGPDEDEQKRSDLKNQLHKTIDVLDEPEDLESLLAHCRGVAADCLKKKADRSPAKEGSEEY